MLGNDVAEGVELLREVAGFGDGCVVVVARDHGQVPAGVVRAGRESEVRAAVRHVDVHRGPGRQQPVEVCGAVCERRGVVLLAPVIEPAAPELHAHQRSFGLVLAQRREAFFDPAAEGSGHVQLGV